ncbi:MAG TPA: protein translocase subunit SecD [Tissierellales bacterium]|nr:protein translocase subunit SecD [Tissierellales bacterium]
MKSKSWIIFILVVAIISLGSYTAIKGIDMGKFKIKNAKESIDLGLDLAGGVYVVLEAQTDAQGAELQKIMEQTKAIMTERVDGLGVSEPNIVIEGNKRIRIELAGVDEPQEAIDTIGKTAQLQFIDPDGEVVLTGKNVKKSEVMFESADSGDRPVVALEFDKEGAKKFEEATKRLSEKTAEEEKILYIVLDDQAISYPMVHETISGGSATITGQFTVDEASNLATLIRAGALPVDMEEIQSAVIGPTLGLQALDKSLLAGLVAIIFIFIFLIVLYRLPGFVASITLTAYILLVLLGMKVLDVKLTLPGIAGLVLSIGMAVDANILIFERIKEELQVGKTVRLSIDSGFKRALTSVLDSNITTLIAGAVLYYFGEGPIKGFGVTLILGIVASMITAVFITKYLLKLTVGMTGGENTKLYGA